MSRTYTGFDLSGPARQAEYERDEALRKTDAESGNKAAFCTGCGRHYTELLGSRCDSDGDRYYPHVFPKVTR